MKKIGLWFKIGLKHFENIEKENMNRHLILFGLFMASNNRPMVAEGLYRQAIDKIGDEKSYSLVMALNFYGRMILKNPKREKEAT